MQEIWKDIPGYEGLYQASNLGRIRSLDAIIYRSASRTRNGYYAKKRGKILHLCNGVQGYLVVNLGQRHKNKRVHRLVALTFIPNPGNKPMINHIDGNVKNNNINNLEWCTNQENQIHAVKVLHRSQGEHQNKPVKCIETGEIFINSQRAARGNKVTASNIRMCASPKYPRQTCMGYHWEFV